MSKMGKVMGEFKAGTLRSSDGQKVTDRGQAVAIAISEEKAHRKTGKFTAADGAKALARGMEE